MIDKRMGSAAEALDGLGDGSSIMVNGFGGAGVPVQLIRAVEATGARNLTLILNTIRFVDGFAPKLFAEKRIGKVVTTAARSRGKEPSNYERQIENGEFELELVPQGTLAERMRAGGAGIPAFYTPTGYGTKIAEGKEVREFDGRPYLMETALTADFAILRARHVDRWGNVIFHGSEGNFGIAMAMGSKIAVVETEKVHDEPLPPSQVHLPGIFVQRIVELPDGRKGPDER